METEDQLICVFASTIALIACWLNHLGFKKFKRYQFEEIYVHELNPWVNLLSEMGLSIVTPINSDETILRLLTSRQTPEKCKLKASRMLYR